ncbi:MAG TPA: MFS transporter [Ktedonobacteraceae bacterium]|nr:MFS transporter [Ktedonobacteraceae bacterium]
MFNSHIVSRFRNLSPLRLILLSMGLFDELMTGFLIVGMPLLRDQLGLTYAQVGLLFSAGAISSMILEPIINLVSDRGSKRWWILGGLLVLACDFALAGTIRSFGWLLFVFIVLYPAIGTAVGLSEAALIDSAPGDGMRTMTRWTLMSSIGDLLSPLVVSAFVTLSMGWTGLCWLAVGLWLGVATILSLRPFPRPVSSHHNEEESESIGILKSLRKALRDPLLLRWAILAILPTMLDEIFIGFAALYMHDVLHVSEVVIGLVIVIHMIGGFLGLMILDRLVKRIAAHRLLIGLAVLTLPGMIGFLALHSIWLVACSLFVMSLGASGLYPIAQAGAYARQPGHSAMVRTVIGLGAPFEIVLPGIVGLVASRFGLLAGVGLLGLAPVLILIIVPKRQQM